MADTVIRYWWFSLLTEYLWGLGDSSTHFAMCHVTLTAMKPTHCSPCQNAHIDKIVGWFPLGKERKTHKCHWNNFKLKKVVKKCVQNNIIIIITLIRVRCCFSQTKMMVSLQLVKNYLPIGTCQFNICPVISLKSVFKLVSLIYLFIFFYLLFKGWKIVAVLFGIVL